MTLEYFLPKSLYERRLYNKIIQNKEKIPKHLTLVLSENDILGKAKTLKPFIYWCKEIGIIIITIYISVNNVNGITGRKICARLRSELTIELNDINANINIISRTHQTKINTLKSPIQLNISIGYSGKYELLNATKAIMKKVESGEIEPKDINESLIESHLLFKHEPDLVIRAGGKRLTDFLIWQAVYSELYFTDVNWNNFRKIDLLRAIRDYQKRQRRYGK